MRIKPIWLALLILLPFSIWAQNGQYSIDHVDGLWNTDTLSINSQIIFHIRTENNTGVNITGQTNGFRIYSDDGAQWTTTIPMSTGAITTAMFEQTFINTFSIDGSGADTVGFAGFRLFMPGIPNGFNEITYTVEIGPVAAEYHKKHICIDSSFYFPVSAWTWSTQSGDRFPDWTGPHCYTIFDPTAPSTSNIVLSEDTLNFSGLAGGATPTSQQFLVHSDGNPLFFTLTENTSWLVLSPIQGTTPRNINVSINNIGLPSGSYTETIVVESDDADNSPQYVVVNLNLAEPPPVISVSDNLFYFNAVAGGANPPSKTLTISNNGGGVLNWSVTNVQSWLSLNPGAGTGTGAVTLSADITGLTYNDYYDTITVSDPAATNNPVRIPVVLSIGSDLPILQVSDTFNFVNVPVPSTSIPPWPISISNGGAGAMNFWVVENSPRILSLTPSSGTVPNEVMVGFKVTSGSAGDDYFDTVWVYSNEAINSPLPVIFQLHFTENPAVVGINRDTMQVMVFECDNGTDNDLPFTSFIVDNIGGDDPMYFRLHYESVFFTLTADSGIAPMMITLNTIYNDLPAGLYYDTIVAEGINSLNMYDTVIVKYVVSSGLSQPKIKLSQNGLVIPVQENSGPTIPVAFSIRNQVGGCMPWEIQEDVPWLYPDITSGDVPASLYLGVDATGEVMGVYQDSMYVVAPTASNSPRLLLLILKVWRFHGDWNYDGNIFIRDLVMNVDYLFNSGPSPEPELIVGDLTCDREITVSDLTYMVAYLFQNGPIPCGNPYK